MGFGFFICVSKSDKERKGRHMLVTNHVVNIVNRINICDNIEKKTCINTRVWVPFPFDSICEHMLHQQEFIFKAPNVWNRPALFARQTLLSIYHQTVLLCYLFKLWHLQTFQILLWTHQSQRRKVFTSTLLPCISDDITLCEIVDLVWTDDPAA